MLTYWFFRVNSTIRSPSSFSMKIVGMWICLPRPSSARIIRPGFSLSMLSVMTASLAPWIWELRDFCVKLQSPRFDSTILLDTLLEEAFRDSYTQFYKIVPNTILPLIDFPKGTSPQLATLYGIPSGCFASTYFFNSYGDWMTSLLSPTTSIIIQTSDSLPFILLYQYFQILSNNHTKSHERMKIFFLKIIYLKLFQKSIAKMGSQTSSQNSDPNPEQSSENLDPKPSISQDNITENQFILESFQSMEKKRKIKYFWLDRKIYNQENTYYCQYLKSEGIDLEEFSLQSGLSGMQYRLEELDKMKKIKLICSAGFPQHYYNQFQNNPRISEIFLFSMNKERSQILIKTYSKIKIVVFTVQDLKKAIKRDKEYFQEDNDNVHFFMNQDKKYLNMYRLNYHCLLFLFDRKSAKSDFIKFVKSIYSCKEQKAIAYFQKDYDQKKNKEERIKQTMKWMMFGKHFYWQSIDLLFSRSLLPKQLAYVRLPFFDIYEAINSGYENRSNKVKQVFIVMKLSPKEKNKLQQNRNKFLMFTSFARGYTDENSAMNNFKRNHQNFIFRINLKTGGLFDETHDYGYWICQDENEKDSINVFFNVFNFFKVLEVNIKQQEVQMEYGSISDVILRGQNPRKSKQMSEEEKNLFINWTYVEQERKKIKKPIDLLKKTDFEACMNAINAKKSTNESEETLEGLIIEMGDLYMMYGYYSQAFKSYSQIKSPKKKYIAVIRLAKLFLTKNYIANWENHESSLNQAIFALKQDGNIEQALNGILEMTISHMKKTQFKKAQKMIQDGINYGVKNGINLSGNSLMHDFYQCWSICLNRLGQRTEAKNLLLTLKDWQIKCVGSHSSNLIRTEGLLQNIYSAEGDSSSIKTSEAYCSEIIQHIDLNELELSAKSNSVQFMVDQIRLDGQEHDPPIVVQ